MRVVVAVVVVIASEWTRARCPLRMVLKVDSSVKVS